MELDHCIATSFQPQYRMLSTPPAPATAPPHARQKNNASTPFQTLPPQRDPVHLTVLKDSRWRRQMWTAREMLSGQSHWPCLKFKGGISSTNLAARLY